jgi:addiction module HigA family antidote
MGIAPKLRDPPMSDATQHLHPGQYIKAEVIPAGLSVKKAAEMIGVGRPALSNLLNGNAALSPDMALRLEKAFGVKRDMLLQKQAAYDEEQNRHREKEVAVRAYAPSFMDIKAMQIAAWAEKIDTRAQLPALLRKLVFSTGTNLTKVDFPAYDHAQRHGWDAYVETDTTTPWIPTGPSGWEFGCKKNPDEKANEDYAARIASIAAADRKKLTFVFVTPRNWSKKDAWVKEKRAEKRWKDVKAFDANDIEQWLEQSVPAQSWLAEKLGNGSDDILSLEESWARWAKVTKPELTRTLFAGSVESHRNSLANWLKNPPSLPFVVTSDSEEESLAYLACALEAAGEYADRAVVVRSPAALRRVTNASSNFIAVLVTPEVETASAGLHKTQHTIIVRRRSGVESEPHIALDLVGDETFKKGLTEMGIEEEEVRTLSRASGQSLTILRRRLSEVPAIKFPPWAEDNALTRKLIPLGFASAWDSQSKEDKEILSFLMGDTYESIEKSVTELLSLEHSPVWAVGRYCGVASKLDVLYATHRLVTCADLENFFLTARLVLSERDPALDLPEEQRYAARIYGKTRNHSAALREGMCETLVLLAIHGNNLFRERLGYDVEGHVNVSVRELLMPFAAETWASQKSDLPHYAEAAPDLFLDIVEQDLKGNDPKILALLKPASTEIFGGGCPRSGLLWALELLAWKPERLPRVAAILARMCETKIDDNWINKPENSLEAIFRAWMPQTSANVDQRCGVLETITRRFPDVGWRLCIDQFDPASTVGHYSHRPHWRKDASGAGQLVTNLEAYTFARKALDLAIGWPAHTEHTLGDLVQRMEGLEDADQTLIWDKIRAWIANGPSDERKAVLRERIRVYSFTRRARRRGKPSSSKEAAREIYDQLVATDPVVRHQWLFARQWVEESWDEIQDVERDFRKREEKIAKARAEAIAEVWEAAGYDGIFKLCQVGEAANLVGYQLAGLAPADLDPVEFMTRLVAQTAADSLAPFHMCLSGYLFQLDDTSRENLLRTLIERFKAEGTTGEDNIVRMLKYAPCKKSTWQIVDRLSIELQARYWTEASPNWINDDEHELRELVERLLLIKRPKAAFAAVRFHVEKLDSPTLFRLMKDIATTSSDFDTNVRFNSYEIARAFEVLDNRVNVSRDDLAHLEFLYLSALEHEKRGIPNLERQISETPMLFVQAVGLTYKRKDDGEDPPEWHIPNEEARGNVATQAYRLLHKAKRIPGTGDDGKIDLEKLRSWMKEVRSLCKTYGREDAGDNSIGELLSKSRRDEDGIWPAVAVRDVLEEMGNQRISEGMAVGLYNQRGAHWRDVGGKQERDLAAMYRGWSKQTAVEWPFTSRLLERIAHSYDRDAEWHDTNANLRKRLPY